MRARSNRLTGTPMGHVAEDVPRIAHDLVVAMSFDVTDEPYTTHAAAQESTLEMKKAVGVCKGSRVSYLMEMESGRRSREKTHL